MRKLLLFLLLLGAGLLLLWWLDRGRQTAPVAPPRVEEPAPTRTEEVQGLHFEGGPFQATHYDPETKQAVLRIESADARTEGDVDVLRDVVLELFDAKTGTLQARLHAERATPKRVPTEVKELRPKWENRFELEGVRAEVLEGLPLAPVTFETTRAEIDATDLTARRVRTAEPFTARSPALTIAGRGIDWNVDGEELEIAHAGRVEITRADGAPAVLASRGDGRMKVRRPIPGGALVLEAWDGAVLEPGAQLPGRLEAKHVSLRANPSGAVDAPAALERLDADGDVDWTSGDAHFTGQRLAAVFAPTGRLDTARLEGEPRAEIALELGSVVPEAGAERRVVLEGQDALVLTWKDGGYAVALESLPAAAGGPTPVHPSVVTRDFRLESAATIDGWVSEDRRTARFGAGGGVLVTSGEAALEAAEFEVEFTPDEAGQTKLVGTAKGGTRLEGKIPRETGDTRPPQNFTLVSPDGLKLERSARGWRVIESTRVEVTLEGPEGFHARADRITDFVVPHSGAGPLAREGMRFHAEGSIAIERSGDRAGGEQLDVLALDPVPHFVLRGTSASKAFYSSPELGEASALEVEQTGDTWHARGEVSGSAEFRAGAKGARARLEFAGDELTVDLNETPELLPGERVRNVRLVIEGNVKGSVTAEAQTVVARCERLSVDRRSRVLADDVEEELGSLFIAEGTVHADFAAHDGDLAIDCERFEVERTASDIESGFRQLTANGDVHFEGRFTGGQAIDVGGDCEVLTFDAERRGSLEPGPHGRVTLVGQDPVQKLPFRMTAERVDFSVAELGTVDLVAQQPELRMIGVRARADHFTADNQTGVVLSGAVRVSGATTSQVPFTLDADEVVLVGRRPPEGEEESASAEDQLESLSARGGVDFQLADQLRARGDHLVVRRATRLLRLEGMPATFELGATHFESEWVEFDPVLQVLVSTGRGRILAAEEQSAGKPDDSRPKWTLDFLSASTLLELDSVVLVLQEPIFRTSQFQTALRASWAILWLNREAFQNASRRDELLEGLQRSLDSLKKMPKGANLGDILATFRAADLAGLLREIYFEGPVEVLTDGELLARADAIYLDASSQHGWLARATVNLGGQFLGQRQEKLIIKADWLRLSSDGSLRADRATVTSCTFEEPHVSVVTGDLRLTPMPGQGEAAYQLRLEDNRVELYNLLKIPLPTIDFATDKEFKPLLPTLSLANSARFGTLFGFAFERPADGVGRFFDKLARPEGAPVEPAVPGEPGAPAPKRRKSRSDVDAHYKVDGSYLGSRGALIDLGLEIEANKSYWFDLFLGLAYDTGEDKGFVRVDEDDRDTLRRWLRSQAYFDRGKNAWSFSFSDQSDAGVQSEFYEGQFLRYERAETYLQWRRSDGEYFAQGTAKLRVDDFRTDVEELPSLSAYRGRSPLAHFGNLPLVHTGDVSAEYLRRREGFEPSSPFEAPPTFEDVDPDVAGSLDGLGDREVARVDTTQRLEMPLPLGAGWKLTPFVSGRATAWSEGVDTADSPSRLVAEAGTRLGTTFWKSSRHGLQSIAPFVEYRAELAREDDNGEPIVLDAVERLLTGDFVRLGARGRFGIHDSVSVLDVDLIGTHAHDRSDGAPDGWMPLEVFARLLLEPYGHEVEVFHDARYDLDDGRTQYSLISAGTHFGQEWGIQLSHQRGLSQEGEALFEAASVSGLYRWTEKWEFEARESFSLLEDQELDTRFVIRRYGHDQVFEFENSVREGEGTSFGISIKPRFGYHPPKVGYVPW